MTKYQNGVMWLGLALVFIRFLTTGQKSLLHNLLGVGKGISPVPQSGDSNAPQGAAQNQGKQPAPQPNPSPTPNVRSSVQPNVRPSGRLLNMDTGTGILAAAFELVAVGILTLLAGINNEWGKSMVIVMGIIWLIYIITNATVVTAFGNLVASVTGNKPYTPQGFAQYSTTINTPNPKGFAG